jgi:hypothetical protein
MTVLAIRVTACGDGWDVELPIPNGIFREEKLWEYDSMLAVELGLTSSDAFFLYTALPKSYIS